ncbi:MAG: type I phosphomannose isomerase catalytic subunit [Rikenellaceae bacterium]
MVLKFNPILKSIMWGGEKIAPYKGVSTEQKQIGESWELSGVAGNESTVSEGKYAGCTIPELLEKMGTQLVGEKNYERFGKEFPILIKFIDALDDLSIQVHPNDDMSMARHNKKGKTEMWYVVDAAPGAKLRVGFSEQVTSDEYAAHIANNTILDVLKEYDVSAGDLFFLPAGRIHSIGAGCFIAEIQQTSDVTYRIYDFCRKDKDGNERELHTELSKEAIDYTLYDDYKSQYEDVKNRAVELASCPYFTTDLLNLDKPMTIEPAKFDSFVSVMCLGGSATLVDSDGESSQIKQGETLLVSAATASFEIQPQGEVKLLTSIVKS